MPKASGTAEAPRLGRSGTGSITLFNIQPNDIGAEVVGQDSTAPCRRCGRHGLVGVLQARVVQIRHSAGVGAAWRQPSRSPRQSPPAVTVMARCVSGGAALHRPLGLPQPVKLRRQRPGAVLQVLQVAVAVERPAVDAARLAAPVAGLRGARTGVVGLRPAGASVGLAEPRSGDADLWAGGSSGGSPGVTALGLLPGSDHLSKQASTAEPEPHGYRTPRRWNLSEEVWVRLATRRCDGRRVLDPRFPCPDIRSASGRAPTCADPPGLAG